MARLEIRLWGRFEVRRKGSELQGLRSDTAKALLALLAAEPGRHWPRAVVAELLWPDRPHGGALGNLRHALSVLRKALDDSAVLAADRTTIALDPKQDVWIDLVEFGDLAHTPHQSQDALSAWHRAAELWRGEFLEGLQPAASAEWEDWRRVTAERCRRTLADALRSITDHHERNGNLDEVVDVTRRLIEMDSGDE